MLLRHLLLLVALLIALPARAQIGGATAGPWLDLGVGLGAGDLPFTPGVGWTVGVGGFVGKYDGSFALGRHVAVGARVRQDAQLTSGRELLRTAVLAEARRGIDLLVAGLHVGGAAGPLLVTPLDGGGTRVAGGTLRLVGGATWRFRPPWGLVARLEVGVDVADAPRAAPALGLTVGLSWMRPIRRPESSASRRRVGAAASAG